MTAPERLSCPELVELITDYLEGTLSPAEETAFEEHLRGCSGCRNYLEQMRLTIKAAGTLTEDTLPAGARETLLDLFRDWKRR